MLQLFANGQQLDTAGVKFNLTLKNPLFSRTTIEGSYAYNINLPKTDNNKLILNFPGRIEHKEDILKTYSIDGYFNGLHFIDKATGTIDDITQEIKLNIGIGSGDLFYNIKEKLICDVDLGRKVYENYGAATVDLYNTISKNYPEVDFNLPYIDETYGPYLPIDTVGYHHHEYINWWDGSNFVFTDDELNKGIIVPMLYLRLIIKNLFKAFGYQVDDNAFFNKGYNDLLLFNLFNINGGIPDSDEETGYAWDITTIEYRHLMPECKISEFLLWLQNRFNFVFFINGNSKVVKLKFAEDILLSADYIDITSKVTGIKTIKNNDLNGFNLEIALDDLDKYYGEQIEDKTYGGVLEKVGDLPELPIRFFKYYVLETKKFYIWYDFDPQWSEMGSTLFDSRKLYIPGKNNLDLVSQFHTLWSFAGNSVAGYSAYDWRKMQPALTFYRGQLQDGRPYSEHYKGTKNLTLVDESSVIIGTYKNHFKKWIDWLLSRDKIVEINMKAEPLDILNFDFTRLYRVNGINYMVSQVKIPIDERSIGEATMTCYKV